MQQQEPSGGSAVPTALSSSVPEKENALSGIRVSALHDALTAKSGRPSKQQQHQPSPTAAAVAKRHHRLSHLPAVDRKLDAEQQAFWVGHSQAADNAVHTTAASAAEHEASRDAAAAEAGHAQLEDTQLTPLKQLLTLCGQQVYLSTECRCSCEASGLLLSLAWLEHVEKSQAV